MYFCLQKIAWYFSIICKTTSFEKKNSDSEVQKFQESILAQNSFALPTSLMPSSFFFSDITCSNRPQENAATQYNAAVTGGSFSMPVTFKDPF